MAKQDDFMEDWTGEQELPPEDNMDFAEEEMDLDSILGESGSAADYPEIGPDTAAMDALGLEDPSTAELDRLLRETREQLNDDENVQEPDGEPMASEDTDGNAVTDAPYPQEEFRDQEYRDTFDDDFERAFEDGPTDVPPGEEIPPEEDEPEEPGRRRRRKVKKKNKGPGLFGIPHFLATMLYLCIILAVSITFARILWVCADDVLALTKGNKEISVTITDRDTLADITKKLHDAGLVRYETLFNYYGKLTGARGKISSGTFTLNSRYDYMALVNAMGRSSANRAEVEVMIPEGYECRQIFALLEEKGVCTADELGKAAMDGDYSGYWFLDGVSQNDPYCLEGYLFPDTYKFYADDDPERVIQKMLNDFEYRFSDDLMNAISTLNGKLAEMLTANGYDEAYIAAHRFTVREVVIVASMIERETAGADESTYISSVIYNRLTNAAAYPYLNIDATIQYVLGERKAVLTQEDTQIDSPYNTYKYTGLPIGPISNPGLASLMAALNPEDTNYHYYALDPETGRHHFSETYAEHEQFLKGLSNEG